MCVCVHVFAFDPPPRQDVQADQAEICIGFLFDLSTYNTSGGLPAEKPGQLSFLRPRDIDR